MIGQSGIRVSATRVIVFAGQTERKRRYQLTLNEVAGYISECLPVSRHL